MAIGLAKNILIAFSPNITMVLFAMVLQGPFLGVFLPAYLLYITEVVPQTLAYTATTLVAATLSLANVFASVYMGMISRFLNLYQSMVTAIIPIGLAVLIFFLQKQNRKGKPYLLR